MKTELKTCPFCKSSAEDKIYYIQCSQCGATMYPDNKIQKIADLLTYEKFKLYNKNLIKKWNTRERA